ncbi:transducin like enhancer of split 6, transcript variant X3 [Ictidomys tridecemlineatus]|uniref:transducin-like enhancer protein 6 isoform X2 n=1 Tax=Ictidomys tridecemlineatus TaxID=43179 RepID=UPI000B53E5EC|nr:transducin-like enhancer protein 6 isoform X2 [Ictidomys tridecemlineatus]KAG3280758.1 transducin like enhancer of split 6, transcript variant X3 [Ictidomys tridecemlineatus]
MTSAGQPEPKGALGGAGPGPGISDPESPPTLSGAQTLGQLKDQLPRLQLRVSTQLESIFHLLTEVQQDLQEHHRQVEAFLQAVDGQPVEVGRLSPGKRAGQGHQEALSPSSPQLPEGGSPQESDFEDVVTGRQSDWLRPPQSSWDEEGEMPPFWDPEPPFWQDVLTSQLWRIFADVQEKAAQPCRRVTEQARGLDSKGLEPPDTETAAITDPVGSGQEALAGVQGACPSRCARCAVPSLWLAPARAKSPLSPLEDCGEEAALAELAQEPAAGAYPLLKLISWDPSDSGDSWRRPDAPPRQSRRLALPHTLQRMRLLRHGEPVLALAVSSFTRHAFTCSRGGIKVWSLAGQVAQDRFPDSHLPVHKQAPDAYLCTCLLSSNSRTLLTGGHNLGSVCVWDLAAPSLRVKGELPCREAACQALAAKADESLVFAGFTDGSVRIWDPRAPHVVRDILGQLNGAKSIVVKDNDVWTGGLDGQLCQWDLRTLRDPRVFLFKSQIMSLSLRPQEDWLLLGLANGQHWLQHCTRHQSRRVGGKDSAVLGLKFSPYGQWWVSVGMDDLVSVHSMPTGALVFQVPEPSCVLCCDVSADNRLVVVGSGTQASVYLVTY